MKNSIAIAMLATLMLVFSMAAGILPVRASGSSSTAGSGHRRMLALAPTRDELMQRIVAKTIAGNFAEAGNDVDWLADKGYDPPTESLNAQLAKKDCPYRYQLLERIAHCVKGPHGSGCVFACKLQIVDGQGKVRHSFKADVKANWDSMFAVSNLTGQKSKAPHTSKTKHK